MGKLADDRFQIDGVDVDGVGAIAADVLEQDRAPDAQLIDRFDQRRYPPAISLSVIDVLADQRVVDKPRVFAVEAGDADRRHVGQRNVGRRPAPPAGIAVGHRLDPELAGGAEFPSVRHDGHELDQAAERVCTVERALRPAQDFDARQVERVEVGGEHGTIGETGRRSEWSFVDVSGDGRADATGIDAAQDDPRFTGLALDDVSAGNFGEIIGQPLRVLVFQRFAADHRNRLRDIKQPLVALLCRDDDLGEVDIGCAAIVLRCRLIGLDRRITRRRCRRRILGKGWHCQRQPGRCHQGNAQIASSPSHKSLPILFRTLLS